MKMNKKILSKTFRQFSPETISYVNLHRNASMWSSSVKRLWKIPSIDISSVFTFVLITNCGWFDEVRPEEFQSIFQKDVFVREGRSKEMLTFMNLSVDPCQDFYEFSCGKWKLETAFNQYTLLVREINIDLRNMLMEPTSIQDTTAGRKVKEFYRSCMIAERNGLQQQMFFSEFIKDNGGFPAVPGSNWHVYHSDYNWQQIVAQLRYKFGMDILIGLDIDMNQFNKLENSVYLKEPTTLIRPDLCSVEGTERTNIYEPEYEMLEQEVTDNLRQWLSLTAHFAKQLAAEIVTFEFELCMALQREPDEELHQRKQQPAYPYENLGEFSRRFNGTIDFNQFISTSFGTALVKPVFMRNEKYFKHLVKTIAQHNITTVANYIMYRALTTFSLPADDQPNRQRRANHCLAVAKTYFPKAIGHMYYRKYASNDAEKTVKSIFDKIKDSFQNSLQSNWIEENTSRIGVRKLHDITLHFPKYEKTSALDALELDHMDYWHKLAAVSGQVRSMQSKLIQNYQLPQPRQSIEAYDNRMMFQPTHQRIDIGWALLQTPNYHPSFPNSILIATIGQQLAEQLAFAFDDLNWTADPLDFANWDVWTERGYVNRSHCFNYQIGNYLYNQADAFHNHTIVRQLIAKSGGLNVAFNAYLNWLHYLNPNNDFGILSKETLPEMNFSNTQLFFIVYAQMHCHYDRKTAEKAAVAQRHNLSPLLHHDLPRYEVNGPLRNFPEFARDFGCPIGTEMNLADKCIIY